MKDSLELIIKDIYTLDPSLVERDGEVRALVSAFSERKPEVLIDAAFVQSLRADLLTVIPVAPVLQSAPTRSPWWMIYGAPVGVLALLLFMLVPKATPVVENKVLESIPVPTMEADMYMESEAEVMDMKRSMPVEQEGATMMMEADTMMMDAPVASDTFQVSYQEPGRFVLVDFVTLSEASFIVIQTSTSEGPGEVLGMSPLLAAGEAQQLEIKLTESMDADQTFYAVLYKDDGDGLFSLTADFLVYDQSGAPLVLLFSTIPKPLER